MDELARTWGVSAWKCYTQWGPGGRGFFLHDEEGLRMIEKARSLGVKNICVHKGLPFGRESYEHSLARDIGIVATMFTYVTFLIYPTSEKRSEGKEGDSTCRSRWSRSH